ncbi:hypothetical protein [Burkholderia glumae]|uniref:hypothetical protein n=1 Tax=Burkholderia glumae TaxID=337 RepID=UPI0035300124
MPLPGKTGRVLEQHEAIAAGDAAGAQRALRAHLSGTLSQVDDICARYAAFLKY